MNIEETPKYKKDIVETIICEKTIGTTLDFELLFWFVLLPTALICGVCLFRSNYVSCVVLYNFARDCGYDVDKAFALYAQGKLSLEYICDWTGIDYTGILSRYTLPCFAAVISAVVGSISALILHLHNKHVEKHIYEILDDVISPRDVTTLVKETDPYEYATLCTEVIHKVKRHSDYKPAFRIKVTSFMPPLALMLFSYTLLTLFLTGIAIKDLPYTSGGEFLERSLLYSADDTYEWYIDNLEVEWNEK